MASLNCEDISDDLLEEHLMERVNNEALADLITEHLLFCEHCQIRSEELEEFRQTFREAFRDRPAD